MKKLFEEFKKFIARGNVMDLAVAVIIGGAFGKITTSLVNDIVMPLISAIFGFFGLKGGVAGMSLVLNGVEKYVTDAATGTMILNPEAILWNYGNFIQTVLDFLLISLVVFFIIKAFNAANKGLQELTHPVSLFTREEKKAFKKQGLSHKEIKQLEEKKIADNKAAEAAAEAAKVLPETDTELLKQIRDLLKEKEICETSKKEQ